MNDGGNRLDDRGDAMTQRGLPPWRHPPSLNDVLFGVDQSPRLLEQRANGRVITLKDKDGLLHADGVFFKVSRDTSETLVVRDVVGDDVPHNQLYTAGGEL